MTLLALDVGGANLKLADGRGLALSRPFALWRSPQKLAGELTSLLAEGPPGNRLVATMTGELADCYRTKAEGVREIVAAILTAAGSREVWIYRTDGAWVAPSVAQEQPWRVAAANWHALARFAGQLLAIERGLLIDIGSTTTDLIPIVAGRPAALGATDSERLIHGELVYTGVERSPICGVVRELPWRERRCPVAQELFATTWDAYLLLGQLPEEPGARHTADGRPATRAAARDRLARMICADREIFSEDDSLLAAQSIRREQLNQLAEAARRVLQHLPGAPKCVVTSGQGEFLARALALRIAPDAQRYSLADRLGPELSRCATAHALATLARDEIQA